MKNPFTWPAALFICLSWSACQMPLSMVDTNRLNQLVEMSKGPCFGHCPVYLLTVYDNGVASYRGERYTEKMGLYLKRLAKPELQNLAAALRRADLWKYNDVYRSDFPDLPAVSITYYEGDRSKSILGKEGRPEAVVELETLLTNIANSGGWKLRNAPDFGLPPGAIPDQLIVELHEAANPEAWMRGYSRQEMKLISTVWPSNSKLIVSYNLKLIDPRAMIDFVRQDVEVLSAEFNRK